MAYGLQYQLYCLSKKDNTYILKIYEDGYLDAEIDRNIPRNPFKLRKDRADIIRGTSLEFALREAVDFEYIKFFTSVPKRYLCQLEDGSANILWKGYLNTHQYGSDYKPAPNTIWFNASDGLGLLKNEELTLSGLQSELDIIIHCIDKIGLDLGYAIAISIWEANHNTALSPLEQTYIDCDVNFDEDDCYTVLEKILSRYDAEISQVNGRWEIISSIDKKSTRLLYTSAGVYDTTQEAPEVLDLDYPGSSGDVWPVGALLWHSLESGGKQVKITHDYGRKSSYLLNYLFERYSSSMFEDWTKSGTFNISQVEKDDACFAFLHTYSNSDSDYMSQEISVVNDSGRVFGFEIDVCPVGRYLAGSGVGLVSVSMEVRMQITLVVGATTHYLTSTGWSTTPGYFTETLDSSIYFTDITWTHLKILTLEIPGDGVLTVKLQRYKSAGPGSGISYTGIAFKDPKVYFLNEDGELPADKYEETAVFDNSTEQSTLPAISIEAADAPDVTNKTLLYEYITRLSDGIPTSEWKLADNDTVYTLLQLYLKLLASRNRCPRQTLKGTIRGSSLSFNSIIKHAYNSDREFEIAECTWDLYEEKFDATLLEVLSFSHEEISLSDGTILGSAADLTVASVTLGTNPVNSATPFNITVRIENTGEMPGRNTIQWKIVDGSDNTISSGTHTSQVIAASDDDDDTFAITSPTAPGGGGTYYVKCKMITDSEWVASAALTVNPPALDVAISSQTDCTDQGGSNGAVTVAGSGGYPAYQYKLDSGSYQSSGTFSALAAGDYVITVKDSHDDTDTVNVSIEEPDIDNPDGDITVSSAINQKGYSNIEVYPDTMATSAALVDTGDGTAWASIVEGATGEGDFTLAVKTLLENLGAERSCTVRVSDDDNHADDCDVTFTQQAAP